MGADVEALHRVGPFVDGDHIATEFRRRVAYTIGVGDPLVSFANERGTWVPYLAGGEWEKRNTVPPGLIFEPPSRVEPDSRPQKAAHVSPRSLVRISVKARRE